MKGKYIWAIAVILICTALFSACIINGPNGDEIYVPEPVAVDGLTAHFFHNTEECVSPSSPALVSSKMDLARWENNALRYWDGEGNEIREPELSEYIEGIPNDFFVTKQLLLIRIAAGSSGYRHKVTKFEYQDSTLFVEITPYVPGAKRGESFVLTDDMAYWLVIIEIDTQYPADTRINLNGNPTDINGITEQRFKQLNDESNFDFEFGEVYSESPDDYPNFDYEPGFGGFAVVSRDGLTRYSFGGYPDCLDDTQLIGIITTDSRYDVFGFSVGSSFGIANVAFAEKGYEQFIQDGLLKFKAGKITFHLSVTSNIITQIVTTIEVTNHSGVVF